MSISDETFEFDNHMQLVSDKNYYPDQQRCPVVLIVDTSSSMSDMMDELNGGVRLLKKIMMEDDLAHDSVNLAIVEMGNAHATIDQEFTDVPSWQVKEYKAGGVTPMAEAVDLAIEHITNAKAMYREEGISSYRPLLIIFSNGHPTDSEGNFDTEWETFTNKISLAANEKQMICFTFYIGKNSSSDPNEMKDINKAKEIMYAMASEIHGIKYSFQLSDGVEKLREVLLWITPDHECYVCKDDNMLIPPPEIPTSIFDDDWDALSPDYTKKIYNDSGILQIPESIFD